MTAVIARQIGIFPINIDTRDIPSATLILYRVADNLSSVIFGASLAETSTVIANCKQRIASRPSIGLANEGFKLFYGTILN